MTRLLSPKYTAAIMSNDRSERCGMKTRQQQQELLRKLKRASSTRAMQDALTALEQTTGRRHKANAMKTPLICNDMNLCLEVYIEVGNGIDLYSAIDDVTMVTVSIGLARDV
jgi:hypothetical protein